MTLAGSGAAWSFVPAATHVSVAGAQEGADYVDFGYWVENDMMRAGDPYTADAFFKGENPHDAVGSVDGTAGTWRGAFYGGATAVNGVTPQPGSVAGEFTAGFHNGDVIGAFGAGKQ